MSTPRDFISRVRSTHKLLSGDGTLTDRAIWAELKATNLLLMKRETDTRRLWNTDSVFHDIGCLRMESVKLNDCCDGPDGVEIARSKHRLPKIAEGNHAYLIQGVFNITGNKKLTEVTLSRYINLMKLTPIKRKSTYYFILDGYLYVTNPDIKAVRIRAHFEGDIPMEILAPKECDVCKTPQENKCPVNPLDQEFKHAGYLASQIVTMTSQSLLGTYFRINDDKSTDQKDDQVSKT
jgi:hypothetical protein